MVILMFQFACNYSVNLNYDTEKTQGLIYI